MKTKDFIKMLQEADPTGEGYIRLPGGGAPWFAEPKEGYWDGPYQYLEFGEERKFYPHDSVLVTSTKGYKVDIHVMETDSIIWDANGDMDQIRKRIRNDGGERREKEMWDYIEKEASSARDFHARSLTEWTQKTYLKYFDGGYEVRQPIDKPIGQYNWMKAYPTGFLGTFKKEEQLCQGECMAIIESGKFYYEETEKYYIWKYDPAKGKDWSIK